MKQENSSLTNILLFICVCVSCNRLLCVDRISNDQLESPSATLVNILQSNIEFTHILYGTYYIYPVYDKPVEYYSELPHHNMVMPSYSITHVRSIYGNSESAVTVPLQLRNQQEPPNYIQNAPIKMRVGCKYLFVIKSLSKTILNEIDIEEIIILANLDETIKEKEIRECYVKKDTTCFETEFPDKQIWLNNSHSLTKDYMHEWIEELVDMIATNRFSEQHMLSIFGRPSKTNDEYTFYKYFLKGQNLAIHEEWGVHKMFSYPFIVFTVKDGFVIKVELDYRKIGY